MRALHITGATATTAARLLSPEWDHWIRSRTPVSRHPPPLVL